MQISSHCTLKYILSGISVIKIQVPTEQITSVVGNTYTIICNSFIFTMLLLLYYKKYTSDGKDIT